MESSHFPLHNVAFFSVFYVFFVKTIQIIDFHFLSLFLFLEINFWYNNR